MTFEEKVEELKHFKRVERYKVVAPKVVRIQTKTIKSSSNHYSYHYSFRNFAIDVPPIIFDLNFSDQVKSLGVGHHDYNFTVVAPEFSHKHSAIYSIHTSLRREGDHQTIVCFGSRGWVSQMEPFLMEEDVVGAVSLMLHFFSQGYGNTTPLLPQTYKNIWKSKFRGFIPQQCLI